MTRRMLLPLLLLALLGACAAPAASSPAEAGVSPAAPAQVPALQTVDTAPPDGRTELTLAAVDPMAARSMLSLADRFNWDNADYWIVVKDYSENGAYDLQQAVLRLSTELAAGGGPDLFCFSDGFSPLPYISGGYLADLLPLLDSGGEIGREDIVALDALCQGDGLYYLGPSFAVDTGLGSWEVFGDRWGWTFQEYLDLEASGEFQNMTYNTTRLGFLRAVAMNYLDHAIQWESGTCDLDNPEMREILETCGRIQENPEDPNAMDFSWPSRRVVEKRLAMVLGYVTQGAYLAFEEYMAGERLSWIGWPTVDGSCGSILYLQSIYGVHSQTDAPEGCWEFLQYLLLRVDPAEPHGLPLYRPALLEHLELAQHEDTAFGTIMTQPYVITAEDAQRLLELIDRIETVGVYDETLLQIVEEEAAAYYAGNQTLDTALDMIQSRVSLYLGEQR